MSNSNAQQRPADSFSPVTGTPLPDRVSLTDAHKSGHLGHAKPTSDNSIVLLIDHRIDWRTQDESRTGMGVGSAIICRGRFL
jgi:hypothetical protein